MILAMRFCHFEKAGRIDQPFLFHRVRKHIEEEGWLGGYIGTAIDLSKYANLNVEYMQTSDGWAVAGGVVWRCK